MTVAYYDPLIALWPTLQGTADEKLAAVNALTVAGPKQPVPIAAIAAHLRGLGLWLPIKVAAAAGTSLGAVAAVDICDDMRMVTIDMELPIVGQMLADLVAHNLLSQAQADEIVAMADTVVPWWQANGYSSPIGTGDIEAAGLS